MALKISEYPAKIAFNDTDLFDVSTAGTTSEKMTYLQLRDDLKNYFHTQGGNSYGADLTIGTNDSNDVVIESNNIEAVRVNTSQEVKVDNAVQLGDSNDNVLFQDVYIKKRIRTTGVLSVLGTEVTFNTAVAFDDVYEISVLMKGVDGRWYHHSHTQRANSRYDYSIRDNGGLAYVHIYAETTETNFDATSEIRITVTHI